MDSAILRQGNRDLKLCERIVETLNADGPQRVLLIGKSGIGKTRLAKKVGEHATKKGLCYLALWLHLDYEFVGKWSLYENIAFQIEAYDREVEEEEVAKSLRDSYEYLEEMITAELSRKKRSAEEKNGNKLAEGEKKHASSAAMVPYLLLILDDEGSKTREDKVMQDLGLDSFLKHEFNLKVLITRREREWSTTEYDDEIEPPDTTSEDEIKRVEWEGGSQSEEGTESDDTGEPHNIKRDEVTEADADTKYHGDIKFHTTDESHALHDTFTKDHLLDLAESLIKDETRHLLESLQKDWKIDEQLISHVVRKSMSLPAAIVVLAKSLNCITNTCKTFSPKVKEILKEVLFPCGPAYTDSGSESSIEPCQYNPILHLAYTLLETDNTSKNAIIDCFWHSLDFFKHRGCVYYCELIAQWILEGYFDPVRSVKKAYKDGHNILVELINRGILKTQEDDMIVPEMAMNNLIDLRHHGLLGRSRLRLARVSGGEKNQSLAKITQSDDMIKTLQSERGERVCTLIVSGNRLRREVSIKFFKQMPDLEVVCLFNPTMKHLIPSLKVLLKLRVLVIRDCDLLTDIEELDCLHELKALEVSGASSVTCIPDNFFRKMSKLQSINLSGLGIKHSPSSISQLVDLHSLILRDCSALEDLPDIQNLKKLEVVDVHGARMLKTCFGMKESTSINRTFHHLQQLQLLDFSETKIRRLPIFHNGAFGDKLHSLTWLLLRSCSNLIRLPNLRPLSGLQILDISGTTSLVEITEVCFEQKKELKILNLSGTKITELPFTISWLTNLSQLLLRKTSNLEVLPNIEGLTSLEVLDVSGCTKLHNIEGTFKDMSYLREVNISGTRIETLPEFPEKSSICCLKVVVLADSRTLIHDTWSQVTDAITNGTSESLISSDTIERIQEMSRKESGTVDEVWAFDCPEKKGHRREHFYQGHLYRYVYMNTIPFVGSKSYQEVLKIRGSNGIDQDKETLAKAEFVAFVDNGAASLSSIFNDLKSVKGCWLEMCGDIKILFSGVNEERIRNLETLSITNLGRLKSICSNSFKNLKKLNVDCCPRIITLFQNASQLPISLEVLKIKFCKKLEKVFAEEVELLSLHTLYLHDLPVLSTIGATLPNLVTCKKDKCPELKIFEEKSQKRE